jgi:hypothetical protein
MKREKTVSMTITEAQQRALFTKMMEKERELGERISVSTFLREHLLKPYLNGSGSPPQETPQEITPEQPKEENRWDDIKF